MPDLPSWLVLVGAALLGSTVAGVAGFGAGALLLPVATWTLGIRVAVPVLTITLMLGNVSRAWWSRREIDLPVVTRFLAGAVPATVLGASLFAVAPSEWLARFIGLFLLLSIPGRRLLARGWFRVGLGHFPYLGGAFGFLSALVVATGPVVTPFFLAYGLRRGAYIATEALCAFGMHLTRGLALAGFALLTREAIAIGLILGGSMFLGSWIGRRLLDWMSERAFLTLVEALLAGLGLHLLLFPR